MIIRAGDWIRIESRKHDGSLHRSWRRSQVLQVKPEEILVANRDVEVTESDGRQWIFSGLALCQFHRKKWYNIILLHGEEACYQWHCNIASPYHFRDNTLVYTDYDWDLEVDCQRHFRWLDEEEYKQNAIRYSYPKQVRASVEAAREELNHRLLTGLPPFTSSYVKDRYHRYLSWQNQSMG